MKKCLLLSSLILFSGTVFAKDGWQDRPHVCDMPSGPRLEKCQNWISTVKRPDMPTASCCGDGDAFIADNFELGPNGELYAIITGDYPPPKNFDEYGNPIPPQGFYVYRGLKILIPPEKIIKAIGDANKSGHGAVFLIPVNGQVLCFVFPPLV